MSYGDKHWFTAPKTGEHDVFWQEETRRLGAEEFVDEYEFVPAGPPLQPYEEGARRRFWKTDDDLSPEDKLFAAVWWYGRRKKIPPWYDAKPEPRTFGRTDILKGEYIRIAKRNAYQRAYQARHREKQKRERAEARRQRELLSHRADLARALDEPRARPQPVDRFVHTVIVVRDDGSEEMMPVVEYERRYGLLVR